MTEDQLSFDFNTVKPARKKTKLKSQISKAVSISEDEIDSIVDNIMDTLHNPEKQQYYKRMTQIRQDFASCIDYDMAATDKDDIHMIDMDALGIDMESYNVNEEEFINNFRRDLE